MVVFMEATILTAKVVGLSIQQANRKHIALTCRKESSVNDLQVSHLSRYVILVVVIGIDPGSLVSQN